MKQASGPVVLVSFGSFASSSQMPENIRNAFLQMFSNLREVRSRFWFGENCLVKISKVPNLPHHKESCFQVQLLNFSSLRIRRTNFFEGYIYLEIWTRRRCSCKSDKCHQEEVGTAKRFAWSVNFSSSPPAPPPAFRLVNSQSQGRKKHSMYSKGIVNAETIQQKSPTIIFNLISKS